jgi:ubiquinone/menaquinone biosynthesis C-methylase UbiE
MTEDKIENDNLIYGNYYDKYGSKNPVARFLTNNFIKKIKIILKPLDYNRLLDIGCGEGFITNELAALKKFRITGIDLGEEPLKKARNRYKNIKFIKCSAYELPFENDSFNLVSALEIMEHLDSPEEALEEIKRVSKKWVILSVPDEPLWRILNVISLRYLRDLGNTPGHVNHWTPKEFTNLIKKYFRVLKISRPIPWTIILGEKINT